MKRLCLLASIASATWGQLQFNSFDGVTETPIPNNVYNLPGPFSVGVSQSIRIRVRNRSGQVTCLVRNPASMGTGFSLNPGNPSLPATLAADAAMDFKVDFLPPAIARSASANFEIQYAPLTGGATCSGPNTPTNIIRADLIIQVSGITAAATLSLTPGGPAATQVQFPVTQTGQKSTLRVYLNNPSSTTLTIADPPVTPLDSKGVFTVQSQPPFPLTLNPTEWATVDLQFAPPSPEAYVGAFVLGSLSAALYGNGAAPPFSVPSIVVDSSLVSGIQARLAITLPSAAPSPATGTLTLAFQPAAGAADDSAIHFLVPATRRVSFSFNAGDITATIGTAKEALFQTGTTAGTLTFSVDFLSATTQVKSSISAHAIAIDNTVANRPNDSQLTILLTGFDNSKSATQLAFTFYDTAGVAVPPGRITYDAGKDFNQFFTQSTAGGLFSLLAQFPVKGSTANIATADVDLTNSVGTTTLTKLRFSPCTPLVTTPCSNVNGCPCQ